MDQEVHTFKIEYKGDVIEVKPIATDECTLYIVYLRGEKVMLENSMDDDRQYWIENGDQETERANEIGALIESKFL
jgi:hypothetical protein